MSRFPRHWRLPVLFAGAFANTALAAPEPVSANSSPYVPPLPAVVAFAETNKIPLERFETATDAIGSRPGDSVVALITLFEDARYRQWLVRLTALERTAAEQRAKPAPTIRLHTSTGTEIRFDGAHLALELHTIGPFPDLPPPSAKPFLPEEKRVRKLVNAGFLGLGFDRGARAFLKLRQAAQESQGTKKLDFAVLTKPFPPERIARARPLAEAIGLTPDDERSFFGASLALIEFFNVAQKTPGLQDILSELLDKTSLAWSMLTHGGQLKPAFKLDPAGISPIDPGRWGSNLPPTYRFPFLMSLNGKPALVSQLVVTSPRPPLLASAGIIGAVVEAPVDKTRHLIFRVIAARNAPP